MTNSANETLTLRSLTPTKHARIYDLVQQAGIETSSWATKKDGKRVREPQTNQAYIFNWAFGGNGQPIALCVWHEHLEISDGCIIYKGNLDEFARSLERKRDERFASRKEKQSAQIRANRAWHFGTLVQEAKYKKLPVRLILLRQESGSVDSSEDRGEKADFRLLDTADWFVHERAPDGAFRIVRGLPPSAEPEDLARPPEEAPRYADQFSIPEAPAKVDAKGSAYPRSPEIRAKVLARAQGACEHCGTTGFRMANGSIYLETHHVFPLGENGPDVEWNVLAICPNDHRRAHYAQERDQMRAEMVEKLIELEPLANDALRSLAASSPEIVEGA